MENIEDIESFLKSTNEEQFMNDKLRQNAVIRSLEVIGEAAKNIPDSSRAKCPDIPWKEISGLRDVLSHAYFGVSMKRVWNIVDSDLPKLKKQIKQLKRMETS